MKKKILSLILALLMASSSAAMISADEVATLAASENATHAASAEFLQSQDIMKGKDNGDLALNDNIKRYEMALFVARLSTGWTDDKQWDNGNVNNTGFTDLEGSGAINVMGAISYATQKGIIEGYGNGEFGPEDGITYQDALTMAVRTLGFKDLGWPWEYIEKAIELGLTKDVTDKAYTAVLNRGEVAQLVYNTLNATKKDGSTLAFDVFNMKEETIIITASDRAVFEKGAQKTAAGKVAFKTYDVATGALGKVTYYAAASEFAFEGHADDLAVGTVFKALLNTDDNGNIITAANGKIVKGFTATEKTSFVNANGENQIEAAVKALKLAGKYTRAAGETSVYDAMTNSVVDITVGGIAMDWVTGDILQQCLESDAYTYVSEDGKFYKVAWYYNAAMNKYFRYKTNSNGGIIGFEWLADADLQDAIDKLKAETTTAKGDAGFTLLTKLQAAQQKTAYAELELEKFADNATYLQGVYEEFGLGYIQKVEKVKCEVCKKDHAGYKISNVENKMVAPNAGELSLGNGTFIDFENGKTYSACADHGVWLSELDLIANEAFAIYGYNAATGELKIVKELTKQYGVLRAYSVNKAKVLIGDAMLDLGYDALKGSGFQAVTKNAANYLDGFDALLNTYVEYVEVDGKVVSVRAAEKAISADRYLIMQDFVGVTADGTIVVEAYSTSTGKLSRYLVNSYNGWKKNSFYYYTSAADAMAQFATGSLYYVSNADGISVDIEKFGGYDADGNFVVDEKKVALTEKSYAFTVDGYKIVDGKDADKDLKANEGNYIIVAPKYVPGMAPIYVYTGEVFDTNWSISGKILKSVTGADVFVAIDSINGFALDAYEHGMFMYNGGKVYEAAYDRDAYDTFFGADESLILPTDTYMVVEVIDLYTGKTTTKSLRNISKEELHNHAIYLTIGNNVIYTMASTEEFTFVDAMSDVFYLDRYVDVYGRDARTSADYLFGTFDYTLKSGRSLTVADIQTQLIEDGYYTSRFVKVNSKNLVQYVVTYDEVGNTILNDLAAYAKTEAGKELAVECTYVYNPKTDAVVVYAFEKVEADETEPDETEPKETEPKETEPKETEPKETEPKETEPKETEPKETEPKETEPKETEPKETEPKETEPKETEPAEPVETYPVTYTFADAEAKAGEEVVVSISIASVEGAVANSFSLAYLEYDESVLTFKGFMNAGDAFNKSMFAPGGIDNEKGTVVIALMSAEALNGAICDAVFEVKADAAAGATSTVTMQVQAKMNSTVLEAGAIAATVTVAE